MDISLSFPPRITICLLIIAALFVMDCETKITCNETYYLERYQKETVSCMYDLTFHTVRWYFNDSKLAIMRIDGTTKSGSGYQSGEFDIKNDGSMVINRVEIKHEGSYKISILDSGGVASSAVIKIIVFAKLTELTIKDCRSTDSVLCKKQGIPEHFFELVCVAKNALHPAQITWTALYNNGSISTSDKSFTNDTLITKYEIVSANTSISRLAYNPAKFSLQYFTCIALGHTRNNQENVSLVVEGGIKMNKSDNEVSYVYTGETITLNCPRSSFHFGQMQLPNGTKLTYVNSANAEYHSTCKSDDMCHVTGIGAMVTELTTYQQEGMYICISTNGSSALTSTVNVVKVVLPDNPVTVIAGCEGNMENCIQHVSMSGKVYCSVLGTTPAVNISFMINFTKGSQIVIENEQLNIITSDTSSNTDSHLTTEYHFESCVQSAMLTCFPTEDPFQQTIGASNVILVTDSTFCSNYTFLVAVIVIIIFVALIIITLVAIISWWALKKHPEPYNAINEPFLKWNTKPDSKSSTKKTEEVMSPEKKMQMEFNKDFSPFYNSIRTATDETFQTLLNEFYNDYQVEPFPFLKSFVVDHSSGKGVMTTLTRFLATCTVSKRMTAQNYVGILKLAIEYEKLSVKQILEVLKEMYLHEQISITEYVQISQPVLLENKEKFKDLLSKTVSDIDSMEENWDIFLKVILFSIQIEAIKAVHSIQILGLNKEEITTRSIDTFVKDLTGLFLTKELDINDYIGTLISAIENKMISAGWLMDQIQKCMANNEVYIYYLLKSILTDQRLELKDLIYILDYLTTSKKHNRVTEKQYLELFKMATDNREIRFFKLMELLGEMLLHQQISIEMYITSCKSIITKLKENVGEEHKQMIESIETTQDDSEVYVQLLLFCVANKTISMVKSIEMVKVLDKQPKEQCVFVLQEFIRLFTENETSLIEYIDSLKAAKDHDLIKKEFVKQQLLHCVKKPLTYEAKKRLLARAMEIGSITNDERKQLRKKIPHKPTKIIK